MSQDFQGGDDEDSEDQELALITKTVKKFWKKVNQTEAMDLPT